MTGIELVQQIAAWAFILSGSFFVVVGAVGVQRFPDFWSRLHATSVTDSAGMILLFIGMGIMAGPGLITVKLLIIGVFLFITGPTSTHAVANAALVSGLRPKEAEGLVGAEPSEPLRAACRIRYRHREVPAMITPLSGGRAGVRFDVPQQGVTPGQAAVFYEGDRVLGGGWIE